MLALTALSLAACTGEEQPTNPTTLRPAATVPGELPEEPIETFPAPVVRGPLDDPDAPDAPAEVTRAAEAFIAALSAGDLERAAEGLFMPRAAFARTFRAGNDQNLESIYADYRHLFEQSLSHHAPALRGATFVRVELPRESVAVAHPEGTSYGELLLARPTMILKEVSIRVTKTDQRQHETVVPFEAMFQTDSGWRVIQPIRTGFRDVRPPQD